VDSPNAFILSCCNIRWIFSILAKPHNSKIIYGGSFPCFFVYGNCSLPKSIYSHFNDLVLDRKRFLNYYDFDQTKFICPRENWEVDWRYREIQNLYILKCISGLVTLKINYFFSTNVLKCSIIKGYSWCYWNHNSQKLHHNGCPWAETKSKR
jgi:hypothetical protein